MEHETKRRKVFPKTLVVKVIGSEEQIKTFIEDLPYPRQNITFSHIIKNRDNPGFHVFINIVLPSSDDKEGR